MQTCPSCQSPITESIRFCMSCGAPVNTGAAMVETATAGTPSVSTTLAESPPMPLVQPRLRVSSRTIAIAGLLLCLLFFSPFVSCGAQTWTGAEAFQASIPHGQYDEPKDGLFLILLPVAGVAGMIAGWKAIQRVESGARLGALRALGIVALLAALATACPIGVALLDISRSNGAWKLEWGFWGSAVAALAMLGGALGLVTERRDPT